MLDRPPQTTRQCQVHRTQLTLDRWTRQTGLLGSYPRTVEAVWSAVTCVLSFELSQASSIVLPARAGVGTRVGRTGPRLPASSVTGQGSTSSPASADISAAALPFFSPLFWKASSHMYSKQLPGGLRPRRPLPDTVICFATDSGSAIRRAPQNKKKVRLSPSGHDHSPDFLEDQPRRGRFV
jgi:hypothetical protein